MELVCSWISMLSTLIFLDILLTEPVHQNQWPRPEDVELAEGYLRRFYHLRPRSRTSRSTRATSGTEERLKMMQGFFGLPQTGRLDPQTLVAMKKERCGVPDVDNFSFYPRKAKWKNTTITFRIDKYTPDLSKKEVESSIASALKLWSKAGQLRFIQANNGPADIILSFSRKTHGDFFPFDGPSGVLAHAFEPGEGVGGDVHFDDDETWTAGQKNSGFDLLTVAAHEIGHSLGLSHSKDPVSVMFPNYKYYSGAHSSLPDDDVQGIQTLYGKPIQKPEIKPPPKKCDPNFSVDAVAVVGKEIVFFKNRYMWMRTAWTAYWNTQREGYSNLYLPSINSPVDAAYNIPAKGVAYVFTGPKYWMVQRLSMKTRARSIYEYGFPTRVKQIDAAVHINGKTFFFVGHLYYRYDEQNRRMDSGFPRTIQFDWPGLVRRVDAALELRGRVYLFIGTKAFHFEFRQNRVLNVTPLNVWMGCKWNKHSRQLL